MTLNNIDNLFYSVILIGISFNLVQNLTFNIGIDREEVLV